MGKPRDLDIFRRFDEVIITEHPSVVGIKYGAGHTANQRRLLEARGYELQQTKEFQVVSF